MEFHVEVEVEHAVCLIAPTPPGSVEAACWQPPATWWAPKTL